ncbi:plus-3-domain-containing protein [Rhizodiscina lignyota]|uniref:Plus-3-domain-containing protein n=1 Tax=Rhizodiscina lignyota TaxID=1504668 RepID=A0A9P4IKA8_9PEZI|nr:plus-3-domain-containing protein [Rhizodiscina lignyota]
MAELDLDAELLALAGGEDEVMDTGKPEEPAQSPARTPAQTPARTPTPHSSPKATVEDKQSPKSQPRKGVAQKKVAKPARGGARRRRKDDSDKDASSSPTAASDVDSLGSGAMDESDSEADAPGEPDDDAVIYPVEGKFVDADDKAKIMAMPELQREKILAEREDQALLNRQNAQLKRLLQRQVQEAQVKAEKKKRKAGAADLDDSPRKSARAKTKPTTEIERFKRVREERLKEREKDADRRKRRSTSRRSSQDAEGESEVEWDDGVRQGARNELPPDLRDFERVRIGRSNFARVCFYPKFEETMTGCFARVSVGMDKATGQNVYRMTQIKGFTEGKPYQMEGVNGKIFFTDKYAVVAHGKAEKEWPFIACSDGKFTEQEFNRYRIAVANDNLRLTAKAALVRSCEGINELLGRKWTDKEIDEKLEKQHKYADLALKLELKEREKDEEAKKGRSPPAGKKDLTLEERKLLTQDERINLINESNRKQDYKQIRAAQLQDRRKMLAGRAAAKARAEAAEKAEADAAAAKAALEVPGANIDDLFGSDISRTGTPAPGSGVNTPKRTGTPLGKKLVEKKEKTGLPKFSKRSMDDDVIGAMDFGIEIDI